MCLKYCILKKRIFFKNINLTPPKCKYKNGFYCWPRKKNMCWRDKSDNLLTLSWTTLRSRILDMAVLWSITKEIEKISHSLNLAQDDKEYKFKMHLDSLENQNLRTIPGFLETAASLLGWYYSHTTLIFSYWHFIWVSFLGIIVEPLEPC